MFLLGVFPVILTVLHRDSNRGYYIPYSGPSSPILAIVRILLDMDYYLRVHVPK